MTTTEEQLRKQLEAAEARVAEYERKDRCREMEMEEYVLARKLGRAEACIAEVEEAVRSLINVRRLVFALECGRRVPPAEVEK